MNSITTAFLAAKSSGRGVFIVGGGLTFMFIHEGRLSVGMTDGRLPRFLK